MRNIALLEWGPASLFYILPRERIKVRTAWLEGGPVMPPFLSTMEDAKAHVPDLCVRYALSAYEDLNSAIKNLRRCFGFPYQEYIGYLNTLTRAHRARREHEELIDRLRRWAIFGNVDAVVWIDYAKANQPPGSFKMGPRDSRPFSAVHMEICANGVIGGAGHDDNDGEESEAWTDPDEEQGAHHATVGSGGVLLMEMPSPAAGVTTRIDTAVLLPRRPAGSRRAITTLRRIRGTCTAPGAKMSTAAPASSSTGAPRQGDDLAPGSVAAKEDGDTGNGGCSLSARDATQREESERTVLRSLLQEEYIPAHGSIYKRTITPGPGYYTKEGPDSWQEGSISFGYRPPSTFEKAIANSKALPGPGDYQAKAALGEANPQYGRFNRAEKLVPPIDIARKLPFISKEASRYEGLCLQSPAVFHPVSPEAPISARGGVQPPKYSFSKSRRPF